MCVPRSSVVLRYFQSHFSYNAELSTFWWEKICPNNFIECLWIFSLVFFFLSFFLSYHVIMEFPINYVPVLPTVFGHVYTRTFIYAATVCKTCRQNVMEPCTYIYTNFLFTIYKLRQFYGCLLLKYVLSQTCVRVHRWTASLLSSSCIIFT